MKPIFMETENHKKSWGGSRKKIQIKMRGKPLFYSLFEMLHFTLYTLHFTSFVHLKENKNTICPSCLLNMSDSFLIT